MKKEKINYRDPVLIKRIVRNIDILASSLTKKIRLMEVCGTHTHSIFHFGIRDLLPENVELISGPGCPVCVTQMDFIDQAILLGKEPEVILTTFGDLMRVPGKLGSLMQLKALGAKVEVIYSPLDSLQIAKENPDKKVIFLGVGFETTAPITAITIEQAYLQGLTNFRILNAHKSVPPALRVLTANDLDLDGFILPGHVSAIIGLKPYMFLAEEKHIPGVVVGFEPLDILSGIYSVLKQLVEERVEIENFYRRVVRDEGNLYAHEKINKYFIPVDNEWRGLGVIPDSGLKLRSEWEEFEVREKLVVSSDEYVGETGPCICGLILTGRKNPVDCPSFAKSCQPENPLGACMVSSEGTCAAYYRYRRKGGKENVR